MNQREKKSFFRVEFLKFKLSMLALTPEKILQGRKISKPFLGKNNLNKNNIYLSNKG